MIKKIIKEYIVEIIEGIIVLLALFLIYKGIFNYGMFVRAIILLVIAMSYKYIAHKIGIERYKMVPFEPTKWKQMEEEKNRLNFKERMEKWIRKEIFKRNKWLYDVIFIIFMLIPWTWMNRIIIYIYVKIYDITIIINSNKDVFFKKYEIDATRWNWSVMYNKWYKIIEWVIIYPILRLLLIPLKIRKGILEKQTYKELLKVRFIAYMYSIILLYYGYYEYISEITMIKKIVIVYIYVAIIWPLIMYIQGKFNYKYTYFNSAFFMPSYSSFFNIEDYSIIFRTFVVYIDSVNRISKNYIQIRYGYIGNGYNFICKKIRQITEINSLFLSIVYKDKWKYEKNYGISLFQLFVFFLQSWHYSYNRMWRIYDKGLNIYGEEVKKEYEKYMEKGLAIYASWLMLLMDIRRLSGYPREKWMLKSSEDYSIVCKDVDNEGKYEYIKKELDKYADIRNVPGEYRISMRLYNKIFYYSHIVNYSYTFSSVGEIDNSMKQVSEKEESLYEKISKHYGYKKEDIDDYSFHKFLKEEDDLSEEKRFSSEIQEEICKIIEKNYMERYEDMKDKRELVSEKFIKKELIEKYSK